MSIPVLASRCFDYCSFAVSFEIGNKSFNFVVLFQDGFGYLRLHVIPYEFKDQPFHFCKKKSFGILIWIATESVEFLGYIDLMTILGLPAQEHGVSFIEVFFRISFSNLF